MSDFARRSLATQQIGSLRTRWLAAVGVLWTLIFWPQLALHHVFGPGYPSIQVGVAIFAVACLVTAAYGYQMSRVEGTSWIWESAAAGTMALWSWSWVMIIVPAVILGFLDGTLGGALGVALAFIVFGSGVSLVLALVCFLVLAVCLVVGKAVAVALESLGGRPQHRHHPA